MAYVGGQVFVADLGNNRVQVLNASTGQALSQFSVRFGSVIGISAGVNSSGSPVILATDNVANAVRIFTTSGTLITSIGSGPGSGNGQLNQPRDSATDGAGDVYVADYDNDRIVEFSSSGTWIRSWGTRGTGPGQFNRPYGVALDSAGNVYMADSGSINRI